MKKWHIVVLSLIALCYALFLGFVIYDSGRLAAAAAASELTTIHLAGGGVATATASSSAATATTIAEVPAAATSAPATATAATTTAAPATTTTAAATTTTAAAPTTTSTAPPQTTTVTTAVADALPDGLVIQPYYRIVQAIGVVHVRDAPGGTILQTLGQNNELGEVTTLSVIEAAEAGVESGEGQGWYAVGLRLRPNGSIGWVRATR